MNRIILDTDVASLSFKGRLPAWIATKAVLPYTDDVARTWGEISARAIRRGRPRPANDTWVAACCLTFGLPLATLNVKDFTDLWSMRG